MTLAQAKAIWVVTWVGLGRGKKKEPRMSIGSMKFTPSTRECVSSNYRSVYFHNVDFSMICLFFRLLVWISIWKSRWSRGRGERRCQALSNYAAISLFKQAADSDIVAKWPGWMSTSEPANFPLITLLPRLVAAARPCHRHNFHLKPSASVIKTQFMKVSNYSKNASTARILILVFLFRF